MIENRDRKTKIFLNLNLLLCFVLVEVLLSYLFKIFPSNNESILRIISIAATIPVIINATLSLKDKKISIDLLAGIALIVSLIGKRMGIGDFYKFDGCFGSGFYRFCQNQIAFGDRQPDEIEANKSQN